MLRMKTRADSLPNPAADLDYVKVFCYGFLSILTFGAVPSYLHREPPPVISIPDTGDHTLSSDVLADFDNVAHDIAQATRSVLSTPD